MISYSLVPAISCNFLVVQILVLATSTKGVLLTTARRILSVGEAEEA